nr:hypothetical protein [Tanacetum cinerariifolium]
MCSTSNKQSCGDSDEEDDDENEIEEEADKNDDDSNDDDKSDDERTKSDSDVIPNLNQSNEEYDEQEEEYDDEFNVEEKEKIDDEETMFVDEDDEATKELYEDVNVNLGNKDADMANANWGRADQQNVSQQIGFEQEEEDAHVTLTPVLETKKTGGLTQSSFVSSDFTSKLLKLDNPSINDTTIASLMDTTLYHEITSTTTVPPSPHFFNPLKKEATLTPTSTTSKATTSFNSLLDLIYIFKFYDSVTNLEKDLSEIKQVDQKVNARLPQILPKATSDVATPVIEKNVTECLKIAVLTRSSSQPQSSYEAAATLSEFELTKIFIDKIEKNKSFDVVDYKRELYDALVKSSNTDKYIFNSYGELFSLKRSRDERDKDRDPSARSDRGTKRRKSSKDVESSRDSKSKEKKSSIPSKDAS